MSRLDCLVTPLGGGRAVSHAMKETVGRLLQGSPAFSVELLDRASGQKLSGRSRAEQNDGRTGDAKQGADDVREQRTRPLYEHEPPER